MNSVFGTIGPEGLAVLLTLVIIVGPSGNGHVKAISWGWSLILSVFAGASYAAAKTWPFPMARALTQDGVTLLNSVIQGLTYPVIGLGMIVIFAWGKMSRRAVSIWGIPFWYICSSADGPLGILATKIATVCEQLSA